MSPRRMASKKSKSSSDDCFVDKVIKKRVANGREEFLIKWWGYDE
jgi:hypothetical protein